MSTERNFTKASNDNETYRGVVLRGLNDDMFVIRLLHTNEVFSKDLAEADEFNAISDWRVFGREYNLPLLIEHEDGQIIEMNQHLGGLTIFAKTPRCRGHWSFYNRRSRNTLRRKMMSHSKTNRQNQPRVAV